jgi:hypothetical protein
LKTLYHPGAKDHQRLPLETQRLTVESVAIEAHPGDLKAYTEALEDHPGPWMLFAASKQGRFTLYM